MKLIDLPRYHVFKWDNTLFHLNENCITTDTQGVTHYFWEFHRVHAFGRLSYSALRLYNKTAIENIEVEDWGHYYDFMKMFHPIIYKRDNWEASRPKEA